MVEFVRCGVSLFVFLLCATFRGVHACADALTHAQVSVRGQLFCNDKPQVGKMVRLEYMVQRPPETSPGHEAYTDSNGNFSIIIGELCGFVAAPHLMMYDADCTNVEDEKARTFCNGTNQRPLVVSALRNIAASKTPRTINMDRRNILRACKVGDDYDGLRNSFNWVTNETDVTKFVAHVDTIRVG